MASRFQAGTNIALTGDYNWYSGAAEGINARPLNLYSVRIRAWHQVCPGCLGSA